MHCTRGPRDGMILRWSIDRTTIFKRRMMRTFGDKPRRICQDAIPIMTRIALSTIPSPQIPATTRHRWNKRAVQGRQETSCSAPIVRNTELRRRDLLATAASALLVVPFLETRFSAAWAGLPAQVGSYLPAAELPEFALFIPDPRKTPVPVLCTDTLPSVFDIGASCRDSGSTAALSLRVTRYFPRKQGREYSQWELLSGSNNGTPVYRPLYPVVSVAQM